jgi:MFS family permease
LGLPQILVPLRHRDFRLLWVGQTVSTFGNSVYSVAMPFQLLALGASPIELGVAVGINTAAAVAFLLLGGAVADRVPRRTLILASDVVGAAAVGATALLSAAGLLRVEHVYVTAALLGSASAFLQPAYSAIIADLVPRDILRAGNAVRLLGRSTARIAGPAAGGLAVAFAGPALAFGIDAFTYLFSFATLLLAHPPPRVMPERASILREIGQGFGFAFRLPWLWTATLYFMLVNIAFAGQSGVMTPLLVRDVLAGGAAMFGALTAAYGVGTIVASVLIAQATIRRPGVALFSFELLAGASVLAMGLVPTLPVVVAGMALMGLSLSCSTVIWQTTLQRHVPEHMLGRMTSIDLVGNSLINPVAPLVAAALVVALGPAATFAVAGAYSLTLATIAFIASPVRQLRDDPEAPGRAP